MAQDFSVLDGKHFSSDGGAVQQVSELPVRDGDLLNEMGRFI